uniref:Uncharacterized protein n=1 Tax=Anguilla anguilla TaxID=7936 RepID=A0A0E9WHH6_ANGAN
MGQTVLIMVIFHTETQIQAKSSMVGSSQMSLKSLKLQLFKLYIFYHLHSQ